jgi:LmbE family N-acetylglucosaminyl deacetylase
MKPLPNTFAALCLATSLFAPGLYAQNKAATTKKFADPANLGDERVKPRDGRELPVDQGALGLQQLLRRLNTRASVMNIVAHPDDEDGGMLTLYSRGVGARVADLSLTRGEGGQNAMTGDFEDALGLLRTQELLACDRYSGIDQFFGTEVDFGFSKTKEETFAKWTHERVLYDVVRAIRIYRPLVLTSTWVGGVTDGHGQHQASGEIAQEAFVAAGDPKVFPELTVEGILPWQPLKIYARVPQQAITDKGLFDYATGQYTPARFKNYVTGEVTTTEPSTDVVVHEGETDSLLADEAGKPRSYVQFARIGLSQQKSQVGPGGRMPPAGKFDVSYHRYGSMLPKEKQKAQEENFFDGIDTSIEGIGELASSAPRSVHDSLALLSSQIDQATKAFDPNQPERTAPLLGSSLQQVDVLLGAVANAQFDAVEKANLLHELLVKRVQINDALVLALKMNMDATSTGTEHTVGGGVSVWSQMRTANTEALWVTKSWLVNSTGAIERPDDVTEDRNKLTSERPLSRTLTGKRDFTYEVTRPYFSRDSIELPVYALIQPELRNAPATPPALTAWTQFEYRGTTVDMGRIVHDGSQPISFVPAYSLTLSSHAQLLPQSEPVLSMVAKLSPAPKGDQVGSILLSVPKGWSLRSDSKATDPDGTKRFDLKPPPGTSWPVAELQATAKAKTGEIYTKGYRPVGYGDLPRTNYYTPAVDRIVPVDLKLPAARKIGYLPGTGDAVPEALASIGLTPKILTMADLTVDNLKQFDTVILGVRTYAAHPDLHGAPTQALLEYAKGGGNVVVQYQTAEFTGDDAPYPLTLGRDAEKVVDETDTVRLIEEPNDPAQRLLVVPNRIHPDDFNGWVEERGHGFLHSWDNHYSAPTETHDPGQDPQRGGLVTTQLSQGRWTYLAFAVYRQLPEAVPGAFRLLVNLLEK